MAYTKEQEAVLVNASPVTFADAEVFAKEFGVSTRSVIAKVQSLNLDYVAKPKPVKRPAGMTKTQMVEVIANRLNVEAAELSGLVNARGTSLSTLMEAVAAD